MCVCVYIFHIVTIITVLFTTILMNFTFMLPCIIIDSFLNNQPDAPIIQIYSVVKTKEHKSNTYFRCWSPLLAPLKLKILKY